MSISTEPSTTATVEVSAGSHGATRHAYDVGLLLLRVMVGIDMSAHGCQKLFGWFGGGGLHGTGQFFTMNGYPAGSAMAVVAGLTETLGGIALILGLLTPLAAAAIVGDMLNAVAIKWTGGFFEPSGMEYELLLTVAAASIAFTGPGRYAIDRALPILRAHRLAYGAVAVAFGLVVGIVILLLRK
ncbi:MAG TPA: DoxX family protein [Pseudonocardiaceae bacterium]|jgi:putative oxidoreductase|nr:DoxX family protein [Pseudonocardiaceae bacterium]